MRYTLIHDLTDDIFRYTLVDEDFTIATSWTSTLPELFVARTHRSQSILSLFRSIIVSRTIYPELTITSITLEEFSFEEFSSKYPEFLI